MNNWLVKGQPGRNRFDEVLLRTAPDQWETEKPIPSDMTAGDRVFLYESSPAKRLIAIASVSDPRSGREGTFNFFTLSYLTQRLQNSLHQDEIRQIPGLENPSFLKSGNAATIYRLSTEEADLLLETLQARNPELARFLDSAPLLTEEQIPAPDLDELLAMPEGNRVLRVHLIRERAPGLVKAKKAQVKADKCSLECEVCNFNFLHVYGSRGLDFCEVHHRNPLSTTPPSITRLDALAIVCSNCHRMLHRQPWTTVEELRASMAHLRPVMQHRGHEGSVLYSTEDRLLHGRILGIRDMFIYDGSDIETIEKDGSDIETIEKHFRESVDEYLSME